MDYVTSLAAIAIIAGAGLAVIGFFMGKKLFKHPALKNRWSGVVVGVVIVAVGFVFGGWAVIDNAITGAPAGQAYTPTNYYTPTNAYTLATFTITPSCKSAGGFVLNGDKTTFSLPAMANTTSHAIKTTANATFVQPSMKFILTPQAWNGATATDLATIYYEYAPVDKTIEPIGGGTYYFLTLTSGERNAIWRDSSFGNIQYGSGSSTMLLTSPTTVYLNLTLNTDSCSRVDNTYDPLLSTITFHNADNSWTQTYTFSFFLTKQFA